MHGREEWVLVKLVSQLKPVERPIRPVFPDHHSVSWDYAKAKNEGRKMEAFSNPELLSSLSELAFLQKAWFPL